MAFARGWFWLAWMAMMVARPALAAGDLGSVPDKDVGDSSPDSRVMRQLETQNLRYQVDPDGDFKLVFQLEGSRSQAAWIQSRTEKLGDLEVREVFSIGYRCTGPIPQDVANRLMSRDKAGRLGSWERIADGVDSLAIFVVRLPALAPADVLSESLGFCLSMADSLEQELTAGQDVF